MPSSDSTSRYLFVLFVIIIQLGRFHGYASILFSCSVPSAYSNKKYFYATAPCESRFESSVDYRRNIHSFGTTCSEPLIPAKV